MTRTNRDEAVVMGFGDEWERFDQSALSSSEHCELFDRYFNIFPWRLLSHDAEGFDMGCGSGRWAIMVAPRVGKLHCIDPSSAIFVAMRNLKSYSNCIFHKAGVADQVLTEASMDFGYSLGVLHHVPDTVAGLRKCARLLRPGAPFLLYLYYNLDNRPKVYRILWKASEAVRRIVSRLPFGLRFAVSQLIAASVYWPLARFARCVEQCGASDKAANELPLGSYRHLSFYTMRTDALDRFGTRLEQRFSRIQIQSMMESAGFRDVRFSNNAPFWCAVGFRRDD